MSKYGVFYRLKRVPLSLHRELLAAAQAEGLPIKKAVEQLLRDGALHDAILAGQLAAASAVAEETTDQGVHLPEQLRDEVVATAKRLGVDPADVGRLVLIGKRGYIAAAIRGSDAAA